MATGHATHYARMWDDDETDRYSTWEHDYERNFSTLIVASIFVFAAARLTTYIFEVSQVCYRASVPANR